MPNFEFVRQIQKTVRLRMRLASGMTTEELDYVFTLAKRNQELKRRGLTAGCAYPPKPEPLPARLICPVGIDSVEQDELEAVEWDALETDIPADTVEPQELSVEDLASRVIAKEESAAADPDDDIADQNEPEDGEIGEDGDADVE
jgi:hypothetical protein